MYPEGEEPADRPDILVDDEGHADDLAARVRAVAERVQVDVPENLRGWLAKEFFPLHIKMYSKSRRKAPIYWQLATPSASYSVWLYIHAFSKDTLFRVQNDYVAPKLAHEERRLESLTSELRDGATAAQRKELAAQEAFVEELRAFLEEVKRVAPLWNPNLDDGVIINFAPLWRLVPQNKAWQKELKSTWDALCEGKYDWAHLAMHLWPERVVPKCAKDRSLAIAHGLEDVFWVEGTDGKWTARKTPTRSVDELVRERTSPAVKSALKSLLEAPAATGKRRARARWPSQGRCRRRGRRRLMHPLHDYVAKQLADKHQGAQRRRLVRRARRVRAVRRRGARRPASIERARRRSPSAARSAQPRRVRGLDVRAARGRRAARERRHAGDGRHLHAGLRARPTRLGADGAREGRRVLRAAAQAARAQRPAPAVHRRRHRRDARARAGHLRGPRSRRGGHVVAGAAVDPEEHLPRHERQRRACSPPGSRATRATPRS